MKGCSHNNKSPTKRSRDNSIVPATSPMQISGHTSVQSINMDIVTSNCNNTFQDFEMGLSWNCVTEPHFKILKYVITIAGYE